MIFRLVRRLLKSRNSYSYSADNAVPISRRPAAGSQASSKTRTSRHTLHPSSGPRRPKSTDRAVSKEATTRRLKGKCYVIDGDTIVISGTRIRLAGIDAPELNHPWGKKSKFAMIALCKGHVVEAVLQDDVSYDRIVAKCYLDDGRDLAAELVKQGLAIDWKKYSGGAYRHLEPAGVRKKLWRAVARQQGRQQAVDAYDRVNQQGR